MFSLSNYSKIDEKYFHLNNFGGGIITCGAGSNFCFRCTSVFSFSIW